MGTTTREIKEQLGRHGIKYTLVDEDKIGIGVDTGEARLAFVLTCEEKGEYVRLRSVRYAMCPKGHPALAKVHAKLVEYNYRFKLAKFGWDEDDGEIVAEAVLPLEDASLGDDQIAMMFVLLSKTCSEQYAELNGLINAGGRAGAVSIPRKADPTRWMMAVGIFAIGLAALGGVASLFFH